MGGGEAFTLHWASYFVFGDASTTLMRRKPINWHYLKAVVAKYVAATSKRRGELINERTRWRAIPTCNGVSPISPTQKPGECSWWCGSSPAPKRRQRRSLETPTSSNTQTASSSSSWGCFGIFHGTSKELVPSILYLKSEWIIKIKYTYKYIFINIKTKFRFSISESTLFS